MMVMNNAHDVTINYNVPDGQGVTLEPFLHQVAGRATMMCLNETTVCKPLNFREHFFYKSLPPDIMQFTPRFKGVVNVNIEETSEGNITLTAYPYESENDTDESSTAHDDDAGSSLEIELEDNSSSAGQPTRSLSRSPCKRIRLKRTGSLCVDSFTNDETEFSQQKSISSSLVVNPWIFKVHQEGLKRHLRSSSKVVKKCILLENVASQFRRPCVLDLKMGTRVYGDHDAYDKKVRQEQKCAATTTQKLGFRLAGMQVFNRSSGKFLCRDKYYGNKLDTAGIQDVLHQFFHDGRTVRHELLLPVLKRLRAIRAILEQLRSYRFYASSLLVMYDGDPRNASDRSSSTTTNSEKSAQSGSKCEPDKKSSPDKESSPSKDTCKKVSSSKTASCSPACDSYKKRLSAEDQDKEALASSKDTDSDYSKSSNLKQSESESQVDIALLNGHQVHVDIRMIDFAKSTHQDMDSSFVHDGPDHGYIFGLTNLIQILKEFRKNAAIEVSCLENVEV